MKYLKKFYENGSYYELLNLTRDAFSNIEDDDRSESVV